MVFQMLKFWPIICLFSLTTLAFGQGKLVIEKVEVENCLILCDVIACDAYGKPLFRDNSKIEGSIKRLDTGTKYIIDFQAADPIEVGSSIPLTEIETEMTVLFLLDLSGSMVKQNKIVKAKEAIKQVLQMPQLKDVKMEFAWFHNDISPKNYPLTLENFEDIVGSIEIDTRNDTDLYRALEQKTNELKSYNGNKVLVLLTDGKNDIKNNPLYKGQSPLIPRSQEETLEHLSQLDSTFQIYPVGLGNDASKDFLESIVFATASKKDQYSFGVAPEELSNKFQTIFQCLKPNYELAFSPDVSDLVYGIEQRRIVISYTDTDGTVYADTLTQNFGTFTDAETICQQVVPFWNTFFIGLVFLGILLAVFSFAVPFFNDRSFRRDYIRKYKQLDIPPNRKLRDPLTNEVFKDTDVVVAKGEKVMLFDSWKYIKSKEQGQTTKDYAELFELVIEGNFFSQKGAFQRLNWLWFGALGGLFAWCMSEFLDTFNFQNLRELLTALDSNKKEIISGSIYNEVLNGVSYGFCLVLLLAIVEEIGQSRRINIGRVILRSTIGAIAGALLFFISSAFILKIVPIPYVGGLIGWSFFGTILGLIISLFSGIETKTGLQGGLLAGVIAFHVYFFMNLNMVVNLLPTNFSRMLSLVFYGGLLGFVLFTVVSRLEHFELLCISPKAFAGRRIPISKWLRSRAIDYIYLGKNPNNYIYIKWDDPQAKDRHAKFSYVNNIVYVAPEEGPLLVNDRLVNDRKGLSNGDRIQLGEQSNTILTFLAKEGEKEVYTKSQNGTQEYRPPAKVPTKKRSQKEKESIKKRIQIKRRNS